MTEEIFKKAIDGSLTINDAAAVAELTRRYPYFTVPASALLRICGDELDETLRGELTQCVALSTANAETVYMLLDDANIDHASFYPKEETGKVTTEGAIDKFLSTYGSTSPEEDALLNRLIFNPTPDYSQILAAEEEKNVPDISHSTGDEDQDRLNAFIVKQKQASGQIPGGATPEPMAQRVAERFEDAPPPAPEAADESLLSESLAKIFIKQRHYQRAYEIISQLSLKYPEKNVYFADQLRFLRKVIINSKYSKKE